MKRAFTLAEVLISLGIIGVIAAIALPALNHTRPDRNKVMYFKAYDTLSSTVQKLASNSKIYPVCQQNVQASCYEHPLINTLQPIDNEFRNNKYAGDKKLCNLVATSLGVNDTNCSDIVYNYSRDDYTNGFASPSFTTSNGMRWRIVPQVTTEVKEFYATFQTDVYVDVDPKNNNVDGVDQSCIYDAAACKNPDIFKFLIAADGRVIPADEMGIGYLKTRRTYVDKDINTDNIIASNVINKGRIFQHKNCSGQDGNPCPEGQTWQDEVGCTGDTPQPQKKGLPPGISCMRHGSQANIKLDKVKITPVATEKLQIGYNVDGNTSNNKHLYQADIEPGSSTTSNALEVKLTIGSNTSKTFNMTPYMKTEAASGGIMMHPLKPCGNGWCSEDDKYKINLIPYDMTGTELWSACGNGYWASSDD